MEIKIKKVKENAKLPEYKSEYASGLDLYAYVENVWFVLSPGQRKLVSTGIAMQIPVGYEGQIRSRSGLSLGQGIVVLNSPGTIDSDYRGEVMVIIANLGKEDIKITDGMRIAQMVIAKVEHVSIREVDTLSVTGRGEGGFGSTGS